MDLDSSVIYASLSSLSIPHFLTTTIVHAAQRTRSHLLIILLLDPALVLSHTACWNDVQQLLTFVYVQATKVAQDMNRLLMNIDVLLVGPNDRLPELFVAPQVLFRVDGGMCAALTAFFTNRVQILRPYPRLSSHSQ
jgi:pantetheine-phosphate adenylyltransferase